MIGNCLENVRKNVPLVHNITNYVTVNDVANVLLAAVLTSTSVHLTKTQLRVCSLQAKKLMNFLTRFYLTR